MTESEWLTTSNYTEMIDWLGARMTQRKYILFGCGTARQVFHLVQNRHNHRVVETAERYADGLVSLEEFNAAWQTLVWESAMYCEWHIVALTNRGSYNRPTNEESARLGNFTQRRGMPLMGLNWAALVREVIGDPFHPVTFQPCWRQANDGAALNLARAIYTDHRWEDLPILADALEEAGCAEPTILDHCRQPGQHVRGCWAVDLVLGLQ